MSSVVQIIIGTLSQLYSVPLFSMDLEPFEFIDIGSGTDSPKIK